MTRVIGSEVAIKVRVSHGFAVTDYIGSFMRHSTPDFALATIDADKVICCQFRSDEKLSPGVLVYAQFAMLYTDMEGRRMIRIMNYSWTVASSMFNYFKSADIENLAQFKIRNELS
jgi:hypothetical protein